MSFPPAIPVKLSVTGAQIEHCAERLRATFPNASLHWSELSDAAKQNWREKVRVVFREASALTPDEGAGPDPAP